MQDLERKIDLAIKQYELEKLKDAADRSFKDKTSFWVGLRNYVLAPVTVTSVSMAIAAWLFDQVLDHQREKEKEHLHYIEFFQTYKDAHRERWLTGFLLKGALTWGMPFEVVLERKSKYDKAFTKTNILFPGARDFMDRALLNKESDLFSEKRETLFQDYFGNELRTISGIHDQCLTKAFAVRNDWEKSLWSDKLNTEPAPTLKELKALRDRDVYNVLNNCLNKSTANYGTNQFAKVSTVYHVCANAIFDSAQEALTLNMKIDNLEFDTWKSKSQSRIEEKCELKPRTSDDYNVYLLNGAHSDEDYTALRLTAQL